MWHRFIKYWINIAKKDENEILKIIKIWICPFKVSKDFVSS